MFMQQDVYLLSANDYGGNSGRKAKALDKLLEFQQEDFYGILKEMEGYQLHSFGPASSRFLPNREELLVEITRLNAPEETRLSLRKRKHC